MKNLLIILFPAALTVGCDTKIKELQPGITNELMVNEKAKITIVHPGGTNYYKYKLTDSTGFVTEVDHQNKLMNPGQDGGPELDIFIIKGVKKGSTIIRLTDHSGGAEESRIKNGGKGVINYDIKVDVK